MYEGRLRRETAMRFHLLICVTVYRTQHTTYRLAVTCLTGAHRGGFENPGAENCPTVGGLAGSAGDKGSS